MKLFLTIVTILSTLSCSSSNSEKTKSHEEQTERVQSQDQLPCEICLLANKLDNTEQALSLARFKKQSPQYSDSLKLLKEELTDSYNTKLEEFKTNGNYRTVHLAKDSAEAICRRSILFGSHLSENRRTEIMDTLANEILGMRSGFTLGSRKNIAKTKPRTNENGEMYVLSRTNRKNKVIIEDLDKWRTSEFIAFDAWMNGIDKLFNELHNKPYTEFDEIEKIVFNYQLHEIMIENE